MKSIFLKPIGTLRNLGLPRLTRQSLEKALAKAIPWILDALLIASLAATFIAAWIIL